MVPLTVRARIVVLVLVTIVCAGALVGLAIVRPGDDAVPGADGQLAPGQSTQDGGVDPLAWSADRREALEASAATGYEHVLYAKSPGGVPATAQRVAQWRPLVDEVAEANDLDPEILEAIVFLESAGRPDAQASDDLAGAAGLTQILAETGQNLLDMEIDVAASERLTRGIARGNDVAGRTRERARIDQRFDPRRALEGTARYLEFAEGELGRDDLALVGYHMGVGNLQNALEAYGDDDVPYAELFFDSSPLDNEEAWGVLDALGDDSKTYLWRVYAARAIMEQWREDPAAVAQRSALHTAKNSAEEVLHPEGSVPVFGEPDDLRAAIDDGDLEALDPELLARSGLSIDPQMGELAQRLDATPQTYRALRPEALALLLYLGTGVRDITGGRARLTVTSTARDERYQRAILRSGNGEATRGCSLHTTGFSFDISRDYASGRQAQAFQFWLDRLQAHDLIAWVREPGAIHVTVSPRADQLIPAALGD